MEPLEFQRDWESRNAAGSPRSARDVALHDTDPGIRPGPVPGRARHAAGGPGRPPAQPAGADDMFNEPYSGGDWRDDPGYGYDNVGGGAGPGNLPVEHPSGPYSAPAGYDAGRYDNGARYDPGPYDSPAGYGAGPGNLPAEHPSGPYTPPARYDSGRHNAPAGYDAGPYGSGARYDSGPYNAPAGYEPGSYDDGARYDSGPYEPPGSYGSGPYSSAPPSSDGYNSGPYNSGPYNDSGYSTGAHARRAEIMVADAPRPRPDQASGRGAHSLEAYPARDESALQGYPAARGAVEAWNEDPL